MKKDIHINIGNILPLILLLAIGMALVIGIGKAIGLLARTRSHGVVHGVALLSRAAGAGLWGERAAGSHAATDSARLASADELNVHVAGLLG